MTDILLPLFSLLMFIAMWAVPVFVVLAVVAGALNSLRKTLRWWLGLPPDPLDEKWPQGIDRLLAWCFGERIPAAVPEELPWAVPVVQAKDDEPGAGVR